MKKYKRWIIGISIVLGVVVLCTILSFTLFAVRGATLNFKNDTTKFASQEVQEEIIDLARIPNGKPAFALNKAKIVENLELANPYLKVINIEIKFPNKLVIHCAEREEAFYIETDDGYFICDQELKVLGIATRVEQLQGDPIILKGLNILNKGAHIGEVLNLFENDSVIKSIIASIGASGKTVCDIRGMFKEIKLGYETNFYTKQNEECLTFLTHDNFEIKVCNAGSLLVSKTNLMLSLIPRVPDKYTTHSMVIDINEKDTTQKHIVLLAK